MKIMNKIVSLIMTVVMLFTATPVLQAADFATELDRSELNELRKEISVSISETMFKKDPKSENQLYENVPGVDVLKKRYDLALENYKENLKIYANENNSKENAKYIEELREIAKQKIQDNPKLYYGFHSEQEKERIAFYTVLYEEMEKASSVERHFDNIWDLKFLGFIGYVTGAVLAICGLTYTASSLYFVGITVAGVSFLTMLVGLLFPIPSPKSYFNDINTSYNSESTINRMKEKFLEDPFLALSMFGKGGVDDFALFYIKNQSCAQLLYDAIDIEYYVSKNQNLGNMQARLYSQTIYWQDLTNNQRADYIHNLAERLRAEAN